MMFPRRFFPVACGAAVWLVLGSTCVRAAEPTVSGELRLQPATLTLSHPRQPHSILVSATTDEGQTIDLTGSASFASADDKSATLPVTVDMKPAPISFRHDVMPVFSRGGCNSGACHGYSLGKNGFKLSLRGADPELDYFAIAREFASRRV